MDESGMRNLLLVDDDVDLLQTLEEILAELGVRLLTARDGREALERVVAGGVDAVLCDLRMPGMTGVDFLMALKHRDLHVPVVIYTGYGDRPQILQALRAGAFDFLDKPSTIERLGAVLNRALEAGVRRNRVGEAVAALERDDANAFHAQVIRRDLRMASLLQALNFQDASED